MKSLLGGQRLLSWQESQFAARFKPHAYLTPDENRDSAALDLVNHNQIGAPTLANDSTYLSFECYSSLATEREIAPIHYLVCLWFDG